MKSDFLHYVMNKQEPKKSIFINFLKYTDF